MMQDETHASVIKFADDTFGPCPSNFRMMSRANEELAEALRAIAADPTSDHAAIEAGDVIGILARLAHKLGLDWGSFQVDPKTVPAKYASAGEYFTAANMWMARLLTVLAIDDNHPDAAGLLGNLYNVLQWAIRSFDMDAQDVISAKMVVNRGREWVVDGGLGFHVRPDKISTKPAGSFMGIPVFVSRAMPDDVFAIYRGKLAA